MALIQGNKRLQEADVPDFGHRGVDNDREFLSCVFSSIREIKVGTGTTARKQKSKVIWFVEQLDDNAYQIRKVNPYFVPTGEAKNITFEELMKDYTPEVEIHMAKVEPAMRNLHARLEKGDAHRHNKEHDDAEIEYNMALEVDEENVRAIFGLGLVYAERRNVERAQAVFKQLVDMDAAFQEDHKHLFNEFGISLRKNELFQEATEYYTRALEFCEEGDEHLYYNLARVHYEQGDWKNCFTNVSHALKLNNALREALGLCELIDALHKDTNLLEKYGKPPVPDDVGAEAGALFSSLSGTVSGDAAGAD